MNVLLLGGGGHAKVVIDILEKAGGFNLVGIVDRALPLGERVLDYEVLGRDSDLGSLCEERQVDRVVLAVGDNRIRAKIAASIRAQFPKLRFPNAIHPSAQLGKNVQLGVGNVVMAGCVINCSTSIGDFGIFNTNASVDHDGQIGDFVSLAPNSCAGGSVVIGDGCSISLGANIIDRVKIGAHTIIGAGATVVRDIGPDVVAYGTPAKVIRPS